MSSPSQKTFLDTENIPMAIHNVTCDEDSGLEKVRGAKISTQVVVYAYSSMAFWFTGSSNITPLVSRGFGFGTHVQWIRSLIGFGVTFGIGVGVNNVYQQGQIKMYMRNFVELIAQALYVFFVTFTVGVIKGKRTTEHRALSSRVVQPTPTHPVTSSHMPAQDQSTQGACSKRGMLISMLVVLNFAFFYAYALIPLYRDMEPTQKILVRLLLHPIFLEVGEVSKTLYAAEFYGTTDFDKYLHFSLHRLHYAR